MKEPTQKQKQQYQRLNELFAQARSRYLDAGGDPRRPVDNSYLTEEERKEALELGAQIFGVEVKDSYVYCQGRSWKLTDKQEVKNP
ncbi:hypothetical protein DSM106972_034510 [Dulcicalothrix desertica PCC 7102]|uniref:Uncharacterized protein n=1 Tax=Dulcicalothrix desertica PCC 7102 TaxID=232991 RepID=A0A433VJL5_9CYAN|nr:hypothetical protein [Dulcicalothrix desertica]RUT06245.1 hypothetical protein DSM106972_034510 [Dulcicalothrix desertica PCC 7102]TWH54093.1 hypothetical protein CAL7102_02099 [Dulcicalothrix desertica PCC 7102]